MRRHAMPRSGIVPSLLFCLALLATCPALAQGDGSATETPAAPPAVTAADTPTTCTVPTNLRVTRAWRERTGPDAPDADLVRLDETLVLAVDGLADLRRQMTCEEAQGRKRSLVLYLDDRPLDGLTEYPPSGPEVDRLSFPLERQESSRNVWTQLLGSPSFEARSTRVSIGYADGYAFASDATVRLKTLGTWGFWFWLAIFVLGIAVFWYAATRSKILRGPAKQGETPPYSLSRFQAAVWFFLVLGAYLLIGLVTGDYSTSITPTAVALLGISGATTVASTLVARARSNPADPNARLAALKPAGPDKFWQGIVSDSQGVSFHRFQMVVWTIVFGIVFAWEVYENLGMPRFGETILGLMGVSSGTYVGLKTGEPRDGVPAPVLASDEPAPSVSPTSPVDGKGSA